MHPPPLPCSLGHKSNYLAPHCRWALIAPSPLARDGGALLGTVVETKQGLFLVSSNTLIAVAAPASVLV